MARPKLDKSELREKIVNVRFSESEYGALLDLMDDCGHVSPSTFLRISGLRSKVPPRVKFEVPRFNEDVVKLVVDLIRKLDVAVDTEQNEEISAFLSETRGITSDLAKHLAQHNNPKIIINEKVGE